MTKIEINGKVHEVTEEPMFGGRLIDGLPLNEFLNTLDEDDMTWAAEKGMKLYIDDPEYVADIIQRNEITELE